MTPNEVVAAIKRALLEDEKKFVGCNVMGWPDAEDKEFNRYLVTYTEGPKRNREPDDPEQETGYQTMIVKTFEDSTRQSVMKHIKEALEVLAEV